MGKELPARKPNRLQAYDYSQSGAYFITICIKDRYELLWDNRKGEQCSPARLSDIGKTVDTAILNIPSHYKDVAVEKYVIMPNHIHIILVLSTNTKLTIKRYTLHAPTISQIVKQMKEFVTKQIGFSIWQKTFHNHIIRNEQEHQTIWDYIDTNPTKWQDDCYFSNL